MSTQGSFLVIIIMQGALFAGLWQSPGALKWCVAKFMARINGIETQRHKCRQYMAELDSDWQEKKFQ